jgi:hypothetical protein
MVKIKVNRVYVALVSKYDRIENCTYMWFFEFDIWICYLI